MSPAAQNPVFFISHSSAGLPSNDRTVNIRDTLAEVLESRGWNVFLDREVLVAGDRWRTNIVYGLAQADAAAILFNNRALSSDWVTAEGLILCFHKSTDPAFQLVPVMLEGKTLADTSFSRYQPFELNQIQAFGDEANRTPEEVAGAIADKFDIQRARTVQIRWCSRVCSLLSSIRDRSALERAAGFLKVEIDARTRLAPADVALSQITSAIVSVLHYSEPLDVIDGISEIFLPLDDSGRVQLKKHVLAKWVPNESVELLMSAARSLAGAPAAVGSGVLTVESMGSTAVEQYMNRIRIELQGGGTVWAFSVSAAAPVDAGPIVAHVEEAIRESMVPSPLYDDRGNELPLKDAVRAVMVSLQDVAICVLPSSCCKEFVLRRLRDDYPRILFVAQTGPTTDQTSLEVVKPRRLTPPFTFLRNNQLSILMSRVEAALASANLPGASRIDASRL